MLAIRELSATSVLHGLTLGSLGLVVGGGSKGAVADAEGAAGFSDEAASESCSPWIAGFVSTA